MDCRHSTPGLTREDLRRLPVQPFRTGSAYKADLLLYQAGDGPILLKDYAGKRGVWRSLGAVGTGREARALQTLADVDGVPRFLGRPDRYCVAMTLVPGRRARKDDPELRGNEAFVRDLELLVGQMHARGVVHLDLKHRSNLLVSDDGKPVVLDFESAHCFNPDGFLGRLLVHLGGTFDRLAVLKWKRRLCPEAFTPSQRWAAGQMRRFRKLWLPRRLMDGLLAIAARRPDSHAASRGRDDNPGGT
jgi:hypothetical protein